jgi:hypothetical protein
MFREGAFPSAAMAPFLRTRTVLYVQYTHPPPQMQNIRAWGRSPQILTQYGMREKKTQNDRCLKAKGHIFLHLGYKYSAKQVVLKKSYRRLLPRNNLH